MKKHLILFFAFLFLFNCYVLSMKSADSTLKLELLNFPKLVNYPSDLYIVPKLGYEGERSRYVPKILKYGYSNDKSSNAYFQVEKFYNKSFKKVFPHADYQYSLSEKSDTKKLKRKDYINYNKMNLLRFYVLTKGTYRIKLFVKVDSVSLLTTKWYTFTTDQDLSIKDLIESE